MEWTEAHSLHDLESLWLGEPCRRTPWRIGSSASRRVDAVAGPRLVK